MLKISKLLVLLTTIVSCGYSSDYFSKPNDYLNNTLNNSINNNNITDSNITNNIYNNINNITSIINNDNISNNAFISNNIITNSEKKLIGTKQSEKKLIGIKRENTNTTSYQIKDNKKCKTNNINNEKLDSIAHKTYLSSKIKKINKYDNSYNKFIEEVLYIFNNFINMDKLLPSGITETRYKEFRSGLKSIYKNIKIPLNGLIQFADVFDKFELGSANHKNIVNQYIENQKNNNEVNCKISFQELLKYISKQSRELLSETFQNIFDSITNNSSNKINVNKTNINKTNINKTNVDEKNVNKTNFKIVNKSIGILFELIDKINILFDQYKKLFDQYKKDELFYYTLTTYEEKCFNKLRKNLKQELNIIKTDINDKLNDVFLYCCEEEFNTKEFNKFSKLHDEIVNDFIKITNKDCTSPILTIPIFFDKKNYSDGIIDLCNINNNNYSQGMYGKNIYGYDMLDMLITFIQDGWDCSTKWKIKDYITDRIVPVLNTLKDLIKHNIGNIIKEQHMISFNKTIGLYLGIAKDMAIHISDATKCGDLKVWDIIKKFSDERKNIG